MSESDSAQDFFALATHQDQPIDARPTIAARPSTAAEPLPFAWRDLNRSSKDLSVYIHLGSSQVTTDEQEQFRDGSVVQLDNAVDEPVEIVVGGEVLGYGNVVTVDGKLAIQITEVRQAVQRRLT